MPSDNSALDAGVLSEIMAKSVHELEDDEKTLLIAALRQERAQFKNAEAVGRRVSKSVLTKAAEAPKTPINFEDLGL